MITLEPTCENAAALMLNSIGVPYKFEDSSMVFETDGTFIYVRDFDSDEDLIDPTQICPDYIRDLFTQHNGEEYGMFILRSLSGHGLHLSDQFNNSDIPVDDCLLVPVPTCKPIYLDDDSYGRLQED